MKCQVREFQYSPTAFKDLLARAEALRLDYEKHELALKRHCAAAYSDVFTAFVHLKGMRIFVESVLRYGVPANFCAFIVRPTSTRNLSKLRTLLSDLFAGQQLFGQGYHGGEAGDGEAEGYYPYVHLPFNPLTPVAAS